MLILDIISKKFSIDNREYVSVEVVVIFQYSNNSNSTKNNKNNNKRNKSTDGVTFYVITALITTMASIKIILTVEKLHAVVFGLINPHYHRNLMASEDLIELYFRPFSYFGRVSTAPRRKIQIGTHTN